MIDHVVVKLVLVLLSLSCQMYFDNSVLLEPTPITIQAKDVIYA